MSKALKVLVVDDDEDVAESMADILEHDGHHVELAHSGQEAIRAFEEQQFDLVFMDVVMPEMNGVECLHRIRQNTPKAKVFMMTGYSVDQLLAQASDEGALGILFKPLAPEGLREIVGKSV